MMQMCMHLSKTRHTYNWKIRVTVLADHVWEVSLTTMTINQIIMKIHEVKLEIFSL